MKTIRIPASASIMSAALLAALAGCGGGGGGNDDGPPAATTVILTGIAADGPLAGATACFDLSDNGACDAGEPASAPTGSDGRFTLVVAAADAGRHGIVVDVPATAVDRDTGVAVGTAFRLRAPASGAPGDANVFVSPLSSLVVARVGESGGSVADAAASVQAQLGLAASPLADFVTAADAQAARLARVVNSVGLEVARLAAAANVPAEQAQALVTAATLGDLPTLAAFGPVGTPAEAATAAVAAVLQQRNLSATTVAAQAQFAARVAAAPAPTAASGPFVSLREFRYTSADNYFVRLFTGDSSQLGSDGTYAADELRQNVVTGVTQPFNRNTVYWTGSAWEVCEREYHVSINTPATATATATAPIKGTYCGASKSESRDVSSDLSGRRMADVVAEIRAFPLPDNTGLPTAWGPDPALLGDTVFPAGSVLNVRQQVADVGGTDRYVLTDKPNVQPAFRGAATIADLKRMSGNYAEAGAVVTNLNSIFLGDIAAPQADPTLRPWKRYRVAFDPASDAVRFFTCDNRIADDTSLNCAVFGDGVSATATRADSKVLTFGTGYPAALISALRTKRLFVERDGVVFRGNADLQTTVHQQRLNTTAWLALRDRLGIPAHGTAQAPVASGPVAFLRAFTYYGDANNYNYRFFDGTGVADASGIYTLDDHRVNVSGGVRQPFVFNAEFWTGSVWYACPNDLLGVNRYTLSPRTTTYCDAFRSTTTVPVAQTLDGRNMADVIREIRRYPSKDGTFDYGGYGPNPNATPSIAAATFPAGSTLQYQTANQTREAEQVFTADDGLLRIAPAPNTTLPYEQWPVAATLEEAIAANPGNYAGAPNLSGNITLGIASYRLSAAPDPAYTNEIGYRVAFDANGQKARFFRHNRLVGSNFTTNYVAILDTTYTIETIGGRRTLKFAATPAEVLDNVGFSRIYVERDGIARFGLQTRIFPSGQKTIRLNGVAFEALRLQLGMVAP